MLGTLIRTERSTNSLALTWLVKIHRTSLLVSEEWRKTASGVRTTTSVGECRDRILLARTGASHQLCDFTAAQVARELERMFGAVGPYEIICAIADNPPRGSSTLKQEWETIQTLYGSLNAA